MSLSTPTLTPALSIIQDLSSPNANDLVRIFKTGFIWPPFFNIPAQEYFNIKSDGKVGIGTNTPTSQLDVRALGSNIPFRVTNTAGQQLMLVNANGRVQVNGNLQIGDIRPLVGANINPISTEQNISVNGWVVAKRVRVQIADWADKVFDNDYELKPLSQLEEFIKKNKHLPEIPSEKEVIENGIDVGEMNKLLLQKIEELTLYLIEIKKENENIQVLLTNLKNK